MEFISADAINVCLASAALQDNYSANEQVLLQTTKHWQNLLKFIAAEITSTCTSLEEQIQKDHKSTQNHYSITSSRSTRNRFQINTFNLDIA
jgi:hypothetical protein